MNKNRLLKSDYKLLFTEKNKIFADYCVFYYIQGFERRILKTSASKKLGKACERNFFKRRLKNAMQALSLQSDVFILGVVLKKHAMDFQREKTFLSKKLKKLTSLDKSFMHSVL